MHQLDDIVTHAVCDRVLEPSRLLTMVGTLIARNARHQDRQRAEMRELFAKHREINCQIKNLVDVMEKGGLGSVASIQGRFAARQTELEAINRLIDLQETHS